MPVVDPAAALAEMISTYIRTAQNLRAPSTSISILVRRKQSSACRGRQTTGFVLVERGVEQPSARR